MIFDPVIPWPPYKRFFERTGKRGRPRKIDDMKAYKAQKARERRARTKAEANNAKK